LAWIDQVAPGLEEEWEAAVRVAFYPAAAALAVWVALGHSVDPRLSEAAAAVAESVWIDQVASGPESAEWERAAQAVFDPVLGPLAVWLVARGHLVDFRLSEEAAAAAESAWIDPAAAGPESAESESAAQAASDLVSELLAVWFAPEPSAEFRPSGVVAVPA
jgi:hypothetical protein